jgi:hypothetical protein
VAQIAGEESVNEAKLIGVLSDLLRGKFTPEQWLEWWNKHSAEVKQLLPPGQFLRLKPRGLNHGGIEVLSRCIDEAKLILESKGVSDVNTSVELKQQFERSAKVKRERITFAGMVISIAEDEFAASIPHDFTDVLFNAFMQAGSRDAHNWIRNQLQPLFQYVSSKPEWLEEPQWPWVDGKPMIFVEQVKLPNNDVTVQHLIWDEMLYLFGRRIPCGDGFEIEFKVISQSMSRW